MRSLRHSASLVAAVAVTSFLAGPVSASPPTQRVSWVRPETTPTQTEVDFKGCLAKVEHEYLPEIAKASKAKDHAATAKAVAAWNAGLKECMRSRGYAWSPAH